jgi:hypothetical protein
MMLKMREKRKDSIMPHLTTILSGATVLLCMSPAAAQNAPPHDTAFSDEPGS